MVSFGNFKSNYSSMDRKENNRLYHLKHLRDESKNVCDKVFFDSLSKIIIE